MRQPGGDPDPPESTLLEQTDAIVADATNYRLLLQRVADLMVPRLADWCLIEVRSPRGGTELVACAHGDPGRAALGWELHARRPADGGSPFSVSRVLETGQAVLLADVNDAIEDPRTRDPEDLRIYRMLGVRSAMFAPLVGGGEVRGAMRLLVGPERARYVRADLRVARAVALRAGRVYEHARVLTERDAQRAEREALFATASHELRTPLGALMLSLQSMGHELDNAEELSRARLVGKAHRAVEQTRRLIHLVENQLANLRETSKSDRRYAAYPNSARARRETPHRSGEAR